MAFVGKAPVADLRNFASAVFPKPDAARFLRKYSGQFNPLYDPADIAPRALLEGRRKTIPDFIVINGALAMSDEARLVVESFEPGVHRFVAVEIARENDDKPIITSAGEVLRKPFFLFSVGTRLDAVWVERSTNFRSTATTAKPPTIHVSAWDLDKILLRKSLVAGHHVWRGLHHLPVYLMFSDKIVAAFEAKKLKKLAFTHVREE